MSWPSEENGGVLQELKPLGHSSCYHWRSWPGSFLLSAVTVQQANMCEGLQEQKIINKIHDTFDVMDASSLPSALTSSLVVALCCGDPS